MFDEEWRDRLRGAVDRMLTHPGKFSRELANAGDTGRYHRADFMSWWDADFKAFVWNSPSAQIAGTICQSTSVRFFYDQIFVKEPHTTTPTYWHQDLPYLPVKGEQLPSLWIALTQTTDRSGGLQYVAGSHRWGKIFRADAPGHNPVRDEIELCPDFSEARLREKNKVISWSLMPGDVIVHHPLVIHGALGNETDQRRLGLSMRFIGDDVTWDPRPRTLKLPKDPKLQCGSPITSEIFPTIWRRHGVLSRA